MIKKLKNYNSFISYWVNSVLSMRSFIKEFDKLNNINNDISKGNKVGIVIHPWLITPAPFFSIATGLLLLRRGRHVDFIIDDCSFGPSSILYKIQIFSIKYLCRFLSKYSKIIYISSVQVKQDNSIVTEDYIDNLVSQNAVHFMKGELKVEGRANYKNFIKQQLINAKPHIYSFFKENSYDFLNISGGIYSTSGIYLKYAKHFGIRSTTYDSGFGVLVSSTDGIAAQLSDIPFGVNFLKEEITNDQLQTIKENANKQISDRKSGTDVFGFLDTGINADLIPKNVGVLILLNSVWDSAALGINNIYTGYVEWLEETVRFILNETNENITIRQHPGEKLDYQKPSDDLKKHLIDLFGDNKRILFVDCYSKINTYQLIESSSIVVCYSSTTGIESAIMGKAVVVASNCYYSNSSFVLKPLSLSDYYAIIVKALTSGNKLNSESFDEACLFYFLGQCCNWVFTDFTPMPDDFKKWVKSPKDLIHDINVNKYLDSIENYIPISVIMGKEIIKKNII